MSRSYRKTKIFSITTNSSEKKDKRLANRKLRKRTKQTLRSIINGNSTEDRIPILREVSDVWTMAKDGKDYWKNPNPKDMRK